MYWAAPCCLTGLAGGTASLYYEAGAAARLARPRRPAAMQWTRYHEESISGHQYCIMAIIMREPHNMWAFSTTSSRPLSQYLDSAGCIERNDTILLLVLCGRSIIYVIHFGFGLAFYEYLHEEKSTVSKFVKKRKLTYELNSGKRPSVKIEPCTCNLGIRIWWLNLNPYNVWKS